MSTNHIRTLITILTLVGMILGVQPGVSNARPVPPAELDARVTPEKATWAGSMGVEWITDWPGTADDRPNWYYSANDLYNQLLGANFYGSFNWGQTNAWERDFKAFSYGGNGLVDSVDLAMIGTHGSSAWDPKWNKNLSAVYFSSNNDDWYLSPGEAYRAYGTNNLEWIAFDSCSVLRNDSMAYWHEAFNGLHLMLGFANTMYVVYPGDGGEWGDQMQQKGWWIFGHGADCVTQSWFTAVEDQQPSGVTGRVLAEELNNYNDYLWGQGYVSPDYPNNGGYWYWDHTSGTPKPLQLTAVPTSMQVYQAITRTVNITYVHRIGQAFGYSPTATVLMAPDHSAFYMVKGISDTHRLRVDGFSGGFLYQNLNELWTNPEMPRQLPPSPLRAQSIAEGFLLKNGESLPGYYGIHTIITPTVEAEGVSIGPGLGVQIAATTVTTPTDYMISYARTLDDGNGQQVSVVGPGSRLNVYIGDLDQVVGLKGGWRSWMPVQPAQGIQSTTAVTVPIKTSTKAWDEFLANPKIALAQPPQAMRYDTIGKPAPTLGYYEQSLSISQTHLIPVWIFVADLYTGTAPSQVQIQSTNAFTALVASDVNIYVPAAEGALVMPVAHIVSPTPGTIVMPGVSVQLSGTVTGGTAPYTFHWASSADGVLGTGPSLMVPGLHPDVHSGHVQPNSITLTVIDANGKTSTATVDVTVLLQIYLPIAIKNS